jgi:hypothetical protein
MHNLNVCIAHGKPKEFHVLSMAKTGIIERHGARRPGAAGHPNKKAK